jgi:hypothetical protein
LSLGVTLWATFVGEVLQKRHYLIVKEQRLIVARLLLAALPSHSKRSALLAHPGAIAAPGVTGRSHWINILKKRLHLPLCFDKLLAE